MNTLNRWTWVGAGLFLVGCAAPVDETGQGTAMLEKEDVEQTGEEAAGKIEQVGKDVGQGAEEVGKGVEQAGEQKDEIGKPGELGQPREDVQPGKDQLGREPKATLEGEGPTGQKSDEIIVGPMGGVWRGGFGGFGPWGGGLWRGGMVGPWGGGLWRGGMVGPWGGGFVGGVPYGGWGGLYGPVGVGMGYGYSTGYSCGLYGCVGY